MGKDHRWGYPQNVGWTGPSPWAPYFVNATNLGGGGGLYPTLNPMCY